MVGRGDAAALRRAAGPLAERLDVLGPVDDATKAAALRSVDVFCAPNLGGESFGMVLTEAMAAGAPVLASDLGAFRAVLDGAGVLFRTGDADALAGRAGRPAGRPGPAGRARRGRARAGGRLRLAGGGRRGAAGLPCRGGRRSASGRRAPADDSLGVDPAGLPGPGAVLGGAGHGDPAAAAGSAAPTHRRRPGRAAGGPGAAGRGRAGRGRRLPRRRRGAARRGRGHPRRRAAGPRRLRARRRGERARPAAGRRSTGTGCRTRSGPSWPRPSSC